MRRSCGVRRPRSLKPHTYTERMDVDVAGISVNEGAHYPGRSQSLPSATVAVRRQEEL